MTEVRSTMPTVEDAMEASPTQVTSSMQPPPVPSGPSVTIPVQSASQGILNGLEGTSPMTPSQEEAARALELVMSFFQTQPTGFVEPQEYVMIGKLMEKLKIKRRASESDFNTISKIESLEALH